LTGLIWLRIWTSGELLPHGNQLSGCIKFGQFLDYMKSYITLLCSFEFGVVLKARLTNAKRASYSKGP
jgi:hypothetical protein